MEVDTEYLKELTEENAALKERVANLTDSIAGKNATLDSIRQYADGLIKREQAALECVAELEKKYNQLLDRTTKEVSDAYIMGRRFYEDEDDRTSEHD